MVLTALAESILAASAREAKGGRASPHALQLCIALLIYASPGILQKTIVGLARFPVRRTHEYQRNT